jgi:hypothetical protein
VCAVTIFPGGAHVIVVGRTLRDHGAERISFIRADLSKMTEAKRVGHELSSDAWDILIFTSGANANKHGRINSSEGIELDMAISYLSRYVIIQELAEKLNAEGATKTTKPRIFVWAGPGVDIPGDPDDLGSDRNRDHWPTHMNTVAANEAVVLGGAARYPNINFYGMNPGLVQSDIRGQSLGEGSFKHKLVEGIIGLFFGGPEKYAANIGPLLLTPEIERFNGAMFNKAGHAIHASSVMNDPAYVDKFMVASEELANRGLAAATGKP